MTRQRGQHVAATTLDTWRGLILFAFGVFVWVLSTAGIVLLWTLAFLSGDPLQWVWAGLGSCAILAAAALATFDFWVRSR